MYALFYLLKLMGTLGIIKVACPLYLGISEVQAVQDMYDGVVALIQAEKAVMRYI